MGIRRTFQNLRAVREMTALENVMVGLHADTGSEILHSLLRSGKQRREEREIVREFALLSTSLALRTAKISLPVPFPMDISGSLKLPAPSWPSRSSCCWTNQPPA